MRKRTCPQRQPPSWGSWSLVIRGSPTHGARSNDFGLRNPDAEPFQADIMPLARGVEPDRRNAEIAQDLGAEADLAPFALAAAGLVVIFAAMRGPMPSL